METKKTYPIRVVSRMTGLTPHVIRIWERRYGVVVPERTTSNRRVYNDKNIEKLKLLKKLVDYGYNISQIAGGSIDELRKMIEGHHIDSSSPSPSTTSNTTINTLFDNFILAVKFLDASEMEKILLKAAISYSQPQIIDHLIIPVLEMLGEQWQKGNFRIYHEHLATTVIRKYLSDQLSSTYTATNAPKLIVTTPSGQNHEMGALIVALTAAILGWKIIFLGNNLPAEEIAAVSIEKEAKVVLLSIIYPPGDPMLAKELERLAGLLPSDRQLVVGGRAAASYQEILEKIGAKYHSDLTQLRTLLQNLLMS